MTNQEKIAYAKLETLYKWAKESLEEIANWNGNDYVIRDIAKDALANIKEYEETGKVSF